MGERIDVLGGIMIRNLLLILAGVSILNAQFSGAIQGIVTDASQATVPGVTVTVTQMETGVARTTRTMEDGLFRVLSLAPGSYRVAVHKPGFADAVQEAAGLAAGQTLRVDFSLKVSTQAEQVTVEAQPPLVDTEQGNISGRIGQLEIKETPLNGNNVFN